MLNLVPASALAAAALALSGCMTIIPQPDMPIEQPAAPEGSNGWQKLGEASDFGPVITPVRVVEDSRCPMNARCVWAGRVVVETRITLRGGADVRVVPMTMGEAVQVADGTATLVAAWPDQVTGREISDDEYRFAYRFDGGL